MGGGGRIICRMKCRFCNNEISDGAVFCPWCGMQQPGTCEPQDYEYAAFISYRHAPRDIEVATTVQKAIESYRLPRNVATHAGLQAGRKLGRVFRDEDELPAAHSLPDYIMGALARSRTLVVVCSPDTAQSMWVPHEVRTFAELHGRERIFAVLAAGDELSNIPMLLKEKTVLDAQGIPRVIPTEPLAADLRPESANRASAEKLRVIASVAGCGFDELRQRERARKRKTVATAAVAAALVAGAFGLVAHQANVEHRNALLAESYQLTIESQRLLEQGDRYGAIEAALEALPESESDRSRPYIPEAQQALEDALLVHPDRYASWRPSYRIETATPVGDSITRASMVHADGESAGMCDIAICQDAGCFAVASQDGEVGIYDMDTGRKRAACTLPDSTDAGNDLVKLVPAGTSLVVNAPSRAGYVACFDLETGEELWTQSGTYIYDVTAANDGEHLALTAFPDGAGMATVVVGTRDGEVVSRCASPQVQAPSLFLNGGAFGEGPDDFYVAFGNTLVHESLDENGGQVQTAELAYPITCSMRYANGTVVVASMADEQDEPYAIEAFDADLNPLWSYTGSYRSKVVYHDDGYTLVRGMPAIWSFIGEDRGIVVASAGRDAMMFDARTGENVFQDRQTDVIVSLQTRDDERLEDLWLFMATCDGSISLQAPFVDSDDAIDEFTRTALPGPIRWADEYYDGTTMTAIALSAETGNRILATHSNIVGETNREEQDRTYTLGELEAMAHDTLAQAGLEQ